MDAPVVAVSSDGRKVGAAWMDMRAGDRDVQWTLQEGAEFAAEVRAHDDPKGAQGHPTLTFDGEDTLWCAWEDARSGTARIYAADHRSRKNVAVSAAADGPCAFPSLATAAGVVGVIYETAAGAMFRVVPAAR